MQVIEVRMSNQDEVDGWQVAHVHAGLAKPLENEQPSRKVGIDKNILSADLDEETGVTDEGDAHLPVARELGLANLAGARRDGRMPHQA